MKAIDIHGMTNMELVRGETDEWYWATDYIHGDLYEAEELFRQGHPVRSNRLYLIHYPDGTVYEAVSSTNRSHFGSDLCFLPPFARRIFRCFRPALPAPILFWVKSGSDTVRPHPLQQRLAVHRAGGDSKTDLDDLIISAVQPNTVDLQSRIDLRLSEKVRAENCSDFSHIFQSCGRIVHKFYGII